MDTIIKLKQELTRLECNRKRIVRDSVVHGKMVLGELFDSLCYHKFWGDYNNSYYEYNNVKLFVSTVENSNGGKSHFNLGVVIDNKEFIKNYLECWASDITLDRWIELNGWY